MHVLKSCSLEGSMLCLKPKVASLELLYLASSVKTHISMEYYIETVTMYNTPEKKCAFCPTELTMCLCKLTLLTKVKWQKVEYLNT